MNCCLNCKFRENKNSYWGRCTNKQMEFTFVPYASMPFSFKGTLEQFNDMEKPLLNPVTAPDYKCKYFDNG
jgi:hypothetical protein